MCSQLLPFVSSCSAARGHTGACLLQAVCDIGDAAFGRIVGDVLPLWLSGAFAAAIAAAVLTSVNGPEFIDHTVGLRYPRALHQCLCRSQTTESGYYAHVCRHWAGDGSHLRHSRQHY